MKLSHKVLSLPLFSLKMKSSMLLKTCFVCRAYAEHGGRLRNWTIATAVKVEINSRNQPNQKNLRAHFLTIGNAKGSPIYIVLNKLR